MKLLEEINFWKGVVVVFVKILITCMFFGISLALVNDPFTPAVVGGIFLFCTVFIYWGRQLILTMKKGDANEKI